MSRCSRRKKLTALLALGSILFCGCTASCTGEKQGQAMNTNSNKVYKVMPSNRTTNQWENACGVISHDGTMVLPMDNHEVQIICDAISGEQLWIQTTIPTIEDPNLSAEDLWEPGNWEKVRYQHKLYDLEGNVLEDLGERGISRVCGDYIAYDDGTLKNRDTGKVYFEDVNAMNSAGEYYVLSCDGYDIARVVDENMQIVYETTGGFIDIKGAYYIIPRENGQSGLQTLDGTVLAPCIYDSFSSYYVVDMPYVVAHKGGVETVISAEDGSALYQESGEYAEYDFVQYLLKDAMVIQTREEIGTNPWGYPEYEYFTRMYAYDGTPISAKYDDLAPAMDLYAAQLEKGEETDLLFVATTKDGKRQIINQKEEVLYEAVTDEWMNLVADDRVLIGNSKFYDFSGNQLNERDYDYLYQSYMESSSSRYFETKFVQGGYTISGKRLYDLMDLDGNVLIERVKSIQVLSEDRFWVEKGFSQGLMDLEGNWLYEQSVFDSAAEE